MIDAINAIRGAMKTGAPEVVPWVSSPSYGGDALPYDQDPWLWEQLVRHTAESGVRRFLYWNAHTRTNDVAAADDAYASELFAGLRAPSPNRDLPAIQRDADVIVTGSVRTTYADFVRIYGEPGN